MSHFNLILITLHVNGAKEGNKSVASAVWWLIICSSLFFRYIFPLFKQRESVSPPLLSRLKYVNNYQMDCKDIKYRCSLSPQDEFY